MKKQPQKRLGRGLEGLIGGGLQKPAPAPTVKIDSLRIEPSDTMPDTVQKAKDLTNDLNELLKKTQAEAMEAKTEIFSNAEEIKSEETVAREAAGEVEHPAEPPRVEKPSFPQLSKNTAPAEEKKSGAQGVFMLVQAAHIRLSPFQQRREIAQAAVRQLAESIRSEGLMQPIVVRTVPEGGYELIAGHRRLMACQMIGMEVVPARVVTVADQSAAVMGLIENLQRVDLNPVEEARGYGMLLTDFDLSQEEIAARVGKDRATVANSLRLLLLEVEILGYVAKGQLTTGHAKVLLGLQEGAERVMLARAIVEKALSVREAEALTRRAGNVAASGGSRVKTKRLASDAELSVIKDLERKIVGKLNAPVKIAHGPRGGRVVVAYKTNSELEAILKRMGI